MNFVRRRTASSLLLVAVLAVAGCDSGGGGGGHHAADLEHIHGLGVNPKDGELYVASHHGLFLVTGDAEPKQIAGRTQDFMGFTVIGPDHFLGSGHPGPEDSDQPPHLGLIESTDAGQTWESLSLSGEADFHAMEAKHGQVYGFDSQSGQVMVSSDQTSWDKRAALPMADFAVSPENADEMLATTEAGLQRSTDGGREFAPVDGAPPLYFVDWPAKDRLVGLTPDGQVQISSDAGRSWTAAGSVEGTPQAILAHGESDVFVATDVAIYRSSDNGKTLSELHELA